MLKTSDKDKLIGMPIMEKVARFVDLDMSNNELELLSGVNDATMNRLSKEKGIPVDQRDTSISLENAEKIANAFDRMVHAGKFPDINKDSFDGFPLHEKVRLILNMNLSHTELANSLGTYYMVISKLRRGLIDIKKARISTLQLFENAFKTFIYTSDLSLEQSDVITSQLDVTSENLLNDIYKPIRNFRFEKYLVIDEDNTKLQRQIKSKIENYIEEGFNQFSIEFADNEIDNDYNLEFNFKVDIDDKSLNLHYFKTPKIK